MGAKPWIVSGLLVAVTVAIVLLITREPSSVPDKTGGANRLPPAPRALTEREIQIYIEVWPRLRRKYLEAAQASARAKLAGRPYGSDIEPWLEGLLRQRQMSVADWTELQRRVEFAVEVTRFEANREKRIRELEADIARLRLTLQGARGKRKQTLEKDIAVLEERISMVPRPLAPETRRLMRKYWSRLDLIVPKTK